ncbi:MAG: maleylpyruvate isomerase family mycothiol-dependent enzyme [Actinomycetota bacterium]|nr:maleylpyruvate isomerase family mycothiol-dependent enzyme [Actinomycetota bacterium]
MATDQEVRPTSVARRSAFDHEAAMALAATEYGRVLELLEGLAPEQWSTPTNCPGWDVRAMAGHLLGMAQMVTTVAEMVRQQVTSGLSARRSGASSLDALTTYQVERNAPLSTDALITAMREVAPRAVRGRRRAPALVRNARLPEPQVVGGRREPWTFGFLFDTILTRDPFMHRLDIAEVTGVAMRADADHEGVLVDDIVREWAQRHGQPFRLELSGPAGGTWGDGAGEQITLDSFEFCRALAGRRPATGLLAEQVPF